MPPSSRLEKECARRTWIQRDRRVHKPREGWFVGSFRRLDRTWCVSKVRMIRKIRCGCHREVLGVERSATTSEIKDAYRRLVMIHHPDRGGNQETFLRIQQAYEALSGKDSKPMDDVVRLSEAELRRARERVRVAEERYQKARQEEEEGRLAQEKADGRVQALLNVLLYAWPLSYVVAVLLQAKGFHR